MWSVHEMQPPPAADMYNYGGYHEQGDYYVPAAMYSSPTIGTDGFQLYHNNVACATPFCGADSGLLGMGMKKRSRYRMDPLAKKIHQRSAANQRERKRMRSINHAFEGLRTRLPVEQSDEHKLSKVETLRYAIQYIQSLADILTALNEKDSENCEGNDSGENEKVVVLIKNEDTDAQNDDSAIYGHSLSWTASRDHGEHTAKSPDARVSAKVWVPTDVIKDWTPLMDEDSGDS